MTHASGALLRYLNCALSRYLDEVISLDGNSGNAQFAAAFLSYLGYFHQNQSIPDYRNLEGLMEMLREEGHLVMLSDVTEKCRRCVTREDCGVGKIVLESRS